MLKIERILCPVDFSEPSTHAIELATHLAAWYDSRIAGLHVVTPALTPYPGLPAVDPHANPAADEDDRRRLCDSMRQAFGEATAAGIPLDVMVHVGQPAREILECAAQLPANSGSS